MVQLEHTLHPQAGENNMTYLSTELTKAELIVLVQFSIVSVTNRSYEYLTGYYVAQPL